jgi:hypothetical protein
VPCGSTSQMPSLPDVAGAPRGLAGDRRVEDDRGVSGESWAIAGAPEVHVSAILRKLDVKTRGQAATEATRRGLLIQS